MFKNATQCKCGFATDFKSSTFRTIATQTQTQRERPQQRYKFKSSDRNVDTNIFCVWKTYFQSCMGSTMSMWHQSTQFDVKCLTKVANMFLCALKRTFVWKRCHFGERSQQLRWTVTNERNPKKIRTKTEEHAPSLHADAILPDTVCDKEPDVRTKNSNAWQLSDSPSRHFFERLNGSNKLTKNHHGDEKYTVRGLSRPNSLILAVVCRKACFFL